MEKGSSEPETLSASGTKPTNNDRRDEQSGIPGKESVLARNPRLSLEKNKTRERRGYLFGLEREDRVNKLKY